MDEDVRLYYRYLHANSHCPGGAITCWGNLTQSRRMQGRINHSTVWEELRYLALPIHCYLLASHQFFIAARVGLFIGTSLFAELFSLSQFLFSSLLFLLSSLYCFSAQWILKWISPLVKLSPLPVGNNGSDSYFCTFNLFYRQNWLFFTTVTTLQCKQEYKYTFTLEEKDRCKYKHWSFWKVSS